MLFNTIILYLQEEVPQAFVIAVAIIKYFLILCLVALVVYKVFNFFEMAYVEYINKRLFFNHKYIKKRQLSNAQKLILKQHINFYNALSLRHKSAFEHRVFQIIKSTEFIGKEIVVTEKMKTIIAGTLVKLTFGFRDYKIDTVERIIFYPEEFYSTTNKTYHKGEFNLGYRALVFSWKHVLHGYKISNDNLNLAVHEFIHAIHFYYMSKRKVSTSSAIFIDSFQELTQELDNDEQLKQKLVASRYLREYAYTNQFEFLAVIIETFIETPKEFKAQFPKLYGKVKTMLSFNFAGY
ncbi:zinc-dependent peptidase [Psychroserpens sp. XS_ASV72]|uniref:zinc-dependent peptidase n=1 Tax=Psychroserpens sp. XS_ASV72 TaxID=3241293 RepID=UPI003519B752